MWAPEDEGMMRAHVEESDFSEYDTEYSNEVEVSGDAAEAAMAGLAAPGTDNDD